MSLSNQKSWNSSNLRWLLRLLALAATGVSLYLLSVSISGGSVAGCGDAVAVDCDDLVGGKWGGWFDLPVSGGGAITYGLLFLLLCLQGPSRSLSALTQMQQVSLGLCILASTTAVWFIALQLVLEGFCYYCLGVHACGLIITALLFWKVQWPNSKNFGPKKVHPAIVPVVCGLLGALVLIAGQLVYEPQEYELETLEALPGASPEITETPGNNDEPVAPSELPVDTSDPLEIPEPAFTGRRTVSLASGRVRLRLDEVPILGSRKAKNVAGLLFDYTCKHCRDLHHKIGEALEKYDGQLAIAMLPLPLDKTCNRFISKTGKGHKEACEYAKLVLAVWNGDPGAFAEYDKYLSTGKTPPPLEQARARAAEILETETIEVMLNQTDILRWIERDVVWYGALNQGSIPKLLMPDKLLTGKVASVNVLCRILERAYVGLHSEEAAAPETAKDLTDFGMVLLRDREYEQATSLFQQALVLDPNVAWAYTGLGQVYQVKRDFSSAIPEYRRAYQLDPQDLLTINSLAWILATHPDYGPEHQQEALTLARQAARLSKKKNMNILNTLSAALANAGRFDEAIATTDKAIALARARNAGKHIESLTKNRQLYKQGQPFRINR